MKLYAHPFSSYCQKALIALYENATPFELREISPDQPGNEATRTRLWPLKRMPVLEDRGRTVFEATIIIEYLGLHHPGAMNLVPSDAEGAIEVRMLDRVFDNYVMTPMQAIVFDHLRPADSRDAFGVGQAHQLLESAYGWLDQRLGGRQWAAGEAFTLADCAAAPSLFYADWVHPIDARHARLAAYRRRLLARPSFARAVDEARPFRAFFPPGAPDRD